MKNFNILGVQRKTRLLGGGGGLTKNPYIEGDCLKRGGEGLGQFADLRRTLARKVGVFLRGVDTPMHTMVMIASVAMQMLKIEIPHQTIYSK